MALLWVAQQIGFDTSTVLWIIAGSGAVAALIGFRFMGPPGLGPIMLVSIASHHWRFAR
jgi:hypothetical protein